MRLKRETQGAFCVLNANAKSQTRKSMKINVICTVLLVVVRITLSENTITNLFPIMYIANISLKQGYPNSSSAKFQVPSSKFRQVPPSSKFRVPSSAKFQSSEFQVPSSEFQVPSSAKFQVPPSSAKFRQVPPNSKFPSYQFIIIILDFIQFYSTSTEFYRILYNGFMLRKSRNRNGFMLDSNL